MRQIRSFFLFFLLSAVSAIASPLPFTSDYNVLVFGSMSATSSIGGSVAVGGSASLWNISLAGGNGQNQGLAPASGSDALNLIVGGSLSWSGGSLQNGSGIYEGMGLISSVGTPDGSINFGTAPVDFASLANAAQAASASFAAMDANGTTVAQYNGLTLTGSSTELNVFEVAASDLGAITWMNINVPVGAPVLINVTGTNVDFKQSGLTLNDQAFNHNQNASAWGEVLWNFSAAGTFNMQGVHFGGTLLAPNASVTLSNGQVNGQVVAGTLQTSAMINNFAFSGTKSSIVTPPTGEMVEPAPVPEPETYLLTACGLLMLFVGKRHHRLAKQRA